MTLKTNCISLEKRKEMWRTIEGEDEDLRCDSCQKEPREFCYFENCECDCHK